MKKFVFLISVLFSFIGCDKSNIDKPDLLYPVKLEVDNILITTSDMGITETTTSSTSDSALNKLGYLYYMVFDETGKYLHQVQQLSTAPDFGVFSDQLKAGKYTIILTASKDDILLSTASLTLATTKLKALVTSGDIFFHKSDITVTSDGLNQKFVLKRIVGYLELKSTSPIPGNVTKITLSVINEAPSFLCATDVVDLSTIEKITVTKDVTSSNRSNFSLGKYVMNDQQLLSIQVNAYDASNTLIKSKSINSFKIERNKKTILSASLTDLMSLGAGLDLDDSWSGDSTVVPFQLY